MPDRTWLGVWHCRIYESVYAQGFDSVTAFADSMPSASPLDLANALGSDIAAVQLIEILHGEARNARTMEQFAKNMLVRWLRQRISQGWNVGDDFATNVAGAWAAWKNTLVPEYAEAVWRMWHWVQSTSIPTGWLPNSSEDPILALAFRETHFGTP